MKKQAAYLIYGDGTGPNSDLHFLTGVPTTHGIWVQHPNGARHLILPDDGPQPQQARLPSLMWRMSNFANVLGIKGSRPPTDLDLIRTATQRMVNLHRKTSLLVPPNFPQSMLTALRDEDLNVSLTAETPISKAREIKSPEDITKLRAAQIAAIAGVRRGFTVLDQAMTTNHPHEGILTWNSSALTQAILRHEIETVAQQHGAEANVFTQVFRYGSRRDHARMAVSPPPGLSATDAIIKHNKWVHIDVTTQKDGHYGRYARHILLREDPVFDQRIFGQYIVSRHTSLLKKLKAGVSVAELHKTITRATHPTLQQLNQNYHLGNGIGLERAEGPFLTDANPNHTLKKGQVITIKTPFYFLPRGRGLLEFCEIYHADMVEITAQGYTLIHDGTTNQPSETEWHSKYDNVR